MNHSLQKGFTKKIYHKLMGFYDNSMRKYSIKSYSQEGEDMILRRLFSSKTKGFYVDVGAHHPFRFSNTYYFYKRGWNGINIDAMPGSMKLFDKYRPKDINLEIPIASQCKKMTYYQFNEPALNGFVKKLSEKRDNEANNYFIRNTVDLETKRLDQVFPSFIGEDQCIDFLSIDVEGMDFDVLKSNDWKLYKPNVVLIESLKTSLSDLADDPITRFLAINGYSLFAKTMNTVFYILS